MPIPTQTEMNLVVLQLMTDGKERTRPLAAELAKSKLALTAEECERKTSSGILVYRSRASWAISYLSRAKMLENVRRGVFRVTDYGLSAAQQITDPRKLAREIQETIAKADPWHRKQTSKKKDEAHSQEPAVTPSPSNEEMSPLELIDEAFSQITADLQKTLLTSILDKDPSFFEQLVVDLLVKMGYGEGRQTKPTNDGGVDGIIATDALGFDPIYVQAKRYTPDHKVGRPELQGFAGALGSITRGVFITTSSFADTAVEWARHFPHATLVLIDGERLTQLMIQYDLGVSTEKVYRVKRIDSDYFGEE